MKKIRIIYNPFSGDGSFLLAIDDIVHKLQTNALLENKYDVHLTRINQIADIDKAIFDLVEDCYDAIGIAGGDGTVNLVVNAMMKYKVVIPLAIFPAGTANDFASFLSLPKNYMDIASLIANGKLRKVDVGKINDSYFINVVCVGLFASISQTVDKNLKNSMGKIAYYIKGLEKISSNSSFKVKITTTKDEYIEEAYLVLVMNSSGAGGFSNLAPLSSVSDGLFDIVLFRSSKAYNIPLIFLKTLRGEHIFDPDILYLQDNYFKLEYCENVDFNVTENTDIDGETGPKLPIEINVLKGALQIFSN